MGFFMGYCGCGLGARRVAHFKQFGNEWIEIEGGTRDGAGNDATLQCVCVCDSLPPPFRIPV